MNSCEHVKRTLVDHGLDAIHRNQALAVHLQDCPACQQLLEAWSQIPNLLDQLPQHEPNETLLHIVSKAVASPGSSRQTASRGGTVQSRRRFIAPSLASAAVLLAAIGLSRELLMQESPMTQITPARQLAAGELLKGPDTNASIGQFEDGYLRSENLEGADKPQTVLNMGLDESIDYRGDDAPFFGDRIAGQAGKEIDQLERSSSRGSRADPDYEFESGSENRKRRTLRSSAEAEEFRLRDYSEEVTRGKSFHYEAQPQGESEDREGFSAAPPATPQVQHKQENKRLAESSLRAELALEAPAEELLLRHARTKVVLEDSDREFNLSVSGLASRDGDEAAQSIEMENGRMKGAKMNVAKNEISESDFSKIEAPTLEIVGGTGTYAHAGFDFLGYYQQTQDLHFQQAAGYWANSYIPGDPEIRLLSARLAQWDRSWLENNAALEQDVEPVNQPFDAPADNALSLSLMADVDSVSTNEASHGPTRMRLQIGIRGIEHRRGQRPAMKVGLVVDLPADASDEVRIATRALLDAMLQSKQAGDRFSLVMTGQQGDVQNEWARSLVVPAEDFRFGSLQLAKQLILGQDSTPTGERRDLSKLNSSRINLYEAMERAGAMVKQTDDPSRPLGSSSVLLISAREMPDIDALAALAHERAREGITLSVIPLGSQPKNSSVEKLVLAGLGNRRYLEAPGRAGQLIEEELHASSRAVARAVRLSIRLAPGVRLIDVVGSERLDTKRAQRVREIENSMDRRLSANRGIQADRGEDEGGIQIVIPSIYSGDSVTVLLDIVADQPGAIAEVSLRYKDLVFLRNGSLRGHLDLPKGEFTGGESSRGPAQLNVLKNLLSHHFIEAVERAAAALGQQQPAEAEAVLRAMHATITQVRQALSAWAKDKDLIHDQQVLDRYITALASPRAGTHQSFLVDSLRYAAWAKTHRPLEEWQ